ncbi:hypothetical protein J2Z37_004281 [Ammoniphilus resinae]|uniref:HNH endonuclease n=2 Tax=Ammoniphilus resinae TaxID=861532 RepID=A0ABS4GVH3_9BACL|nr:hypothetical protein [Ammoniphilus resinae]
MKNLRKQIRKALPKNITDQEWEALACQPCVISKKRSTIATVDHFIPLIWGHGGDVKGNLYPLGRELNKLKSSHNPFRWINRKEIQPLIDRKRWDELVHALAAENGLTVKEFTQYVHWCEKHPRSFEEVEADPRPSLEIWKEAKGAATVEIPE